MALVTPQTNRIDTFAAAHGITTSEVVRWNLGWFLTWKTFWLPVNTDFLTASPLSQAGRDLLVDGRVLLVDGRRFVVR